ncbi:MAG TPA: hypothetical protein HPP94_10715 [Desulfuromonadales bacterium]|nr:hypothetical protein [Desulfuromonadales bacterium]
MLKRIYASIMHRLQLRESWVIFFILGIIMMNFPFLHIFNKPVMLFGFPLMFLYLTLGWLVSIGVIYLFILANRAPQNHDKKKTP